MLMKSLKKLNTVDCECLSKMVSQFCFKFSCHPKRLLYYIYDYRQYRDVKDEDDLKHMIIRNTKYRSDQLEIENNIKYVAEQYKWQLSVIFLLI